MSYDLQLFAIPDSVNPSDAFHQLVELQQTAAGDEGASSPTQLEIVRMRSIADALKTWSPQLEEFAFEQPMPWIELNDLELETQFIIDKVSVAISLPYLREHGAVAMSIAADSFAIIRQAAEYRAYDPQLDRTVTADDLDEMVLHYRSVDKGAVFRKFAKENAGESPAAKPWWKFW